jgi:CheY-like chemotaxis protein/anti-sigma regulatory factor (Ser/Thr protein kinase)
VRLDLAAHVRTSWRLLGRVAGEAVALRAQVVPPAWVLADATHLEQVLVNLVANARDAMPFGGTCTIAVSRDPADDLVQLVVEDTGHGMDAATRARAVEPFFTTKPRERGTGLGLATVHGIVQQSGGTLEIDSTPGVGTRIRITLPAAGADDAEPAAARDDAGEAPPHVPVLVVDDDETVRLTVSRLLARAGFAVDTAGDGAAALEILAAQPERHALVLTDVTMPIMGGKALAAEIGTRWPELPVLFMTGYAQQGFDDVPGFEAERDLIAKPFSSRELVQRVIERLGPRAAIG